MIFKKLIFIPSKTLIGESEKISLIEFFEESWSTTELAINRQDSTVENLANVDCIILPNDLFLNLKRQTNRKESRHFSRTFPYLLEEHLSEPYDNFKINHFIDRNSNHVFGSALNKSIYDKAVSVIGTLGLSTSYITSDLQLFNKYSGLLISTPENFYFINYKSTSTRVPKWLHVESDISFDGSADEKINLSIDASKENGKISENGNIIVHIEHSLEHEIILPTPNDITVPPVVFKVGMNDQIFESEQISTIKKTLYALLIFLGCFIAYNFFSYSNHQKRYDDLQSQMVDLYKSKFPDERVINVKRQLEGKLKSQLSQPYDNSYIFMAINQISSATTLQNTILSINLDSNSRSLIFVIRAKESDDINRIRNEMKDFSNVTVLSITEDQGSFRGTISISE